MAKDRPKLTVLPDGEPGYCEIHPGRTVIIYPTINYAPGRGTLRAPCCADCIDELKQALKKMGAKIIDHRGN